MKVDFDMSMSITRSNMRVEELSFSFCRIKGRGSISEVSSDFNVVTSELPDLKTEETDLGRFAFKME